MGLLDILKAIPMAAGEKARADEFGPDYRQRWQKYQDEHVRGELQNAISTTSLNATRSKLAAEAAARMKAYPGMSEGDAYSQQIADEYGRDVEGKTLDISGKRQGQEFAAEDQGFQKKLFPGQLQAQEATLTGAGTRNERDQIELDRIRRGLPPVPPDPNRSMGYMIGPPVTVQDPNDPNGPGIVLDRRTGKPIQIGGTDVHQAPTTDQRNRQTAMGRTHPILQQIEALAIGGVPDVSGNVAASGLNTGREGLMGRLAGYGTSAAAWANKNPKASQYESLVKGFIPMVARAVGHTGVLTQQDVDSVRALFPNFGDSESVAKMKINQVKSIMSAQGQEDVPGTEIPVRLRGMTSPKGTRYEATAVEGGKMYISDGTPGGWAEVK